MNYGSYSTPPASYPPTGYPQQPTNYLPPQDQWGYAQPSTRVSPTVLRVGDAIKYGWQKFTANIGVWLGFMGLFAAIVLVYYIIIFIVLFTNIVASGTLKDSSYGVEYNTVGVTIGTVFTATVVGIFGYFGAAVLTRGSLFELDGVKPHFVSFWRLRNVGNIALVAVLLSLLNAILTSLVDEFVAVGVSLVLGILFWFVFHLLLERGLSFHDAVIANARLIVSCPGPLALLFLTLTALNIAGALPCGLGLFFTIPTSIIATTYAYRVLCGGTVSPAA